MKYHKKLELDYQPLADQVLAYIKSNKNLITSFWNNVDFKHFCEHVPAITTTFNSLNLTPNRVAIIKSVEKNGSIHKDYTPCAARINIPILNCEGSETRFWKAIVEPKFSTLKNSVPYLEYKEADCELVDKVELNCATVLRIREPHSVHTGDTVPRISLTVNFVENIEYLLD